MELTRLVEDERPRGRHHGDVEECRMDLRADGRMIGRGRPRCGEVEGHLDAHGGIALEGGGQRAAGLPIGRRLAGGGVGGERGAEGEAGKHGQEGSHHISLSWSRRSWRARSSIERVAAG